MLNRFSDFNDWPSFGFADFSRAQAPHAQFRRELDRLFGDYERAVTPGASTVRFEDDGTNFVLRADVPGLGENDIQINVAGNTVTLRGERKVDVPEGHSVHRRERAAVRFAKSAPPFASPRASSSRLASTPRRSTPPSSTACSR